MQYHFGEYGKIVEVTGYRGISAVSAEEFLKKNRKQPQAVEVQFFDADFIATQEHLYFATLNALQAFKGKTNISKSVAMETMLFASAQRQIQKAIERSGIKPQTSNLAVVVIGDDEGLVQAALEGVAAAVGGEPDASVLELTKSKREKIKCAFEITDPEVKAVAAVGGEGRAVVDLVVERVALLATQL